MDKFSSYDALRDLIDLREGVIICDMASLRDAHGAGKLGVHVIAGISSRLAQLGLGHSELSLNQLDMIRIFRLGSAVGKLIVAAQSVDETSNKILRQAAGNDDADILRRVRELVCD